MKDWLPSDLNQSEWHMFKDLVLACTRRDADVSLLNRIPPELHDHRISRMLANFLIKGDRSSLESAGLALTGDSEKWFLWLEKS
jgi:hypothetical protein